ncbi:MAG: cell division protein FtsL [Nitrospira sp.]
MKTVTVFLGLCLVFVFVWERVDMVRIGYQIERLKRDKTVLERQRDELRVKFSTLSASGRIAKLATEKLGMSLPQQGQIIVVQSRPRPSGVHPSGIALVELKVARNDLPSGRFYWPVPFLAVVGMSYYCCCCGGLEWSCSGWSRCKYCKRLNSQPKRIDSTKRRYRLKGLAAGSSTDMARF